MLVTLQSIEHCSCLDAEHPLLQLSAMIDVCWLVNEGCLGLGSDFAVNTDSVTHTKIPIGGKYALGSRNIMVIDLYHPHIHHYKNGKLRPH